MANKGGPQIPCQVEVGDRFGKLTILEIGRFPIASRPTQTRVRCLVQCDCGSEPKWIDRSRIAGSQRTNSCGCIRKEVAKAKCKANHEKLAKIKETGHFLQSEDKAKDLPPSKNYWKPRDDQQRERHRISAKKSRWRNNEFTIRTRKHGSWTQTLGQWCAILELDFDQVFAAIDQNRTLKLALQLNDYAIRLKLSQWIHDQKQQENLYA